MKTKDEKFRGNVVETPVQANVGGQNGKNDENLQYLSDEELKQVTGGVPPNHYSCQLHCGDLNMCSGLSGRSFDKCYNNCYTACMNGLM